MDFLPFYLGTMAILDEIVVLILFNNNILLGYVYKLNVGAAQLLHQ